LAREFGLRDDPTCYKKIDELAARQVTRSLLHKDMAYNSEVMPEARAAELADLFLAQFGVGTNTSPMALGTYPRSWDQTELPAGRVGHR